jgi:hypothetical protein
LGDDITTTSAGQRQTTTGETRDTPRLLQLGRNYAALCLRLNVEYPAATSYSAFPMDKVKKTLKKGLEKVGKTELGGKD